ncbi:MAG: tRNA lysidine(34) synthetase TilS [Acidobacteriota bacterium]|nr:tRNA lysidine(34) synthetase TilS [Acidobacteriota bacterium]
MLPPGDRALQMPSLLARVIGTIREHDLAPRGASVVAALSGGSDSVALVELLRDLSAAGELRLAGLAHFHHGLRGEAADADERFCAAVAARVGVPIEIGHGDVARLARDERLSLEDAARRARYAFLERARAALGADLVAVGHTRDDQAETFLLRILRGAGTRGLRAIQPRAGRVIRPLLDCRRDDLRRFLANRGLTYCEDQSNADLRHPRNRLRHAVLPALRRDFNADVEAVLAREAALARDDAALLDELAAGLYETAVSPAAGGLALDVASLGQAPVALARRVIHRALIEQAGTRFVGFDHVEAVRRLCGAGGRGGLDLPGLRVERNAGRVVLRNDGPEAGPAPFSYPLPVPGEVGGPGSGWRLTAARAGEEEARAAARAALAGHGSVALVAATEVEAGLVVRSRRPGDVFRPAGLGGRKKLQDFLVDRKVPRQNRDRLPLVVDAADRIVWVAGHRVAEEFRVTDRTAGVVILRLEAWGGTA